MLILLPKFRGGMAIKVSFTKGLPPQEFFPKAWSDEPLSSALKLEETDISFTLPLPDENVSIVAKENEIVIGQCSASSVIKYWDHLGAIDTTQQNARTRAFITIHQKAVNAEQKFLSEMNGSVEKSLHSAGIAVLPEYRGYGLGEWMRDRQITLCKEHKITTLFCETTDSFSAATVQPFNFTKIAEYPYKDLAVELECPELSKL